MRSITIRVSTSWASAWTTTEEALAEFLDKKPLPWVTLFNDDPAKEGWEGAAMTKPFAIEELPTMIMIDRAGKIVSISARGEALEPLVKKLVAEK